MLVFGLLFTAGTVGTGIAPIDDAGDATVVITTSLLDSIESGGAAGRSAESSATDSMTDASATERDLFDGTPPTATGSDELDIAELERAVHRRVNAVRETEGADPLLWDDDLHEIARAYSGRMVEEGFFGHESPDGERFDDRYERYGYECEIHDDGETYLGGENIVRVPVSGYADGEYVGTNETRLAIAIVDEWLNSPDHRSTMLDDRWNREGIGIVKTNDEVYVTQNFC